MSNQEQFHEAYESAAAEEFDALLKSPVSALLARVASGQLGEFYQVWQAIGAKASLAEAGWPLFEFLQSDAEYLHRYHCAAALIQIARGALDRWQPVMLSAKHSSAPLEKHLAEVKAVLEAKIGPQAQASGGAH